MKKNSLCSVASDTSNAQLKTEMIKETCCDKIYIILKNTFSKKGASSI